MSIDMDWPAGTTVASHPCGYDLVVTPDPGNDGWILLVYRRGHLTWTRTETTEADALTRMQRVALTITPPTT